MHTLGAAIGVLTIDYTDFKLYSVLASKSGSQREAVLQATESFRARARAFRSLFPVVF